MSKKEAEIKQYTDSDLNTQEKLFSKIQECVNADSSLKPSMFRRNIANQVKSFQKLLKDVESLKSNPSSMNSKTGEKLKKDLENLQNKANLYVRQNRKKSKRTVLDENKYLCALKFSDVAYSAIWDLKI